MDKIQIALVGPLCLVIAFCGVGLLVGSDPVRILQMVTVCVPIAAYIIFSIFTVIWAIKIGEIGAKQDASLQAKFFFWHGVAVILTIVLAAAGSFVMLFASLIGGLLSGTVR